MTNENENGGAKGVAEHEEQSAECVWSQAEMDAMAERLEQTQQFRVLRRLEPLRLVCCRPTDGLRCAIVVDTETTGLVLPGSAGDLPPSEIVSLAMVAIAYDPANGQIVGAIDRLHRYRQPSHPIPPQATVVHGITDAMVQGQTITAEEIQDWIASAAATVQPDVSFGSRDIDRLPLLIAHNASFDRKVMEHLYPTVAVNLPWACSQTQVPWKEHGYEGLKLSYLGTDVGFFYGERHSALADADAVVELLRRKLGTCTAMAHLCAAARTTTYRLYVATRYDARVIAALKRRRYRWSNGEGGRLRAWYWEGDAEGLAAEQVFLEEAGFSETRDLRSLDAFDRFSCRA